MSQKQRSNQRFFLSTTGWARNMDFHEVSSLVRKYHIHYDGKRFRASDGLSKPILTLSFQTKGSAQAARKKMYVLADTERLRLSINLDQLNVERRHHQGEDDEAVRGDNGHPRPSLSSRVDSSQPPSFFFQTVKQYRKSLETVEKLPVHTPPNDSSIQPSKIDFSKPVDSFIRPPSPSNERQPYQEQHIQSTESPSLSSMSPQAEKIYAFQLEHGLKCEEASGNNEIFPSAQQTVKPQKEQENMVVPAKEIEQYLKQPSQTKFSSVNETEIQQKYQNPSSQVIPTITNQNLAIQANPPAQQVSLFFQQLHQQCPNFNTCQSTMMELEHESTCDVPQAEILQPSSIQAPRKLSGELLRQLHKDIIKQRKNLNLYLRTAIPAPSCH